MSQLVGFVESFDGETVSGWIGTPARAGCAAIEVFIDDRLAASCVATIERSDVASPDHELQIVGFAHRFEPPYCDPGGPLVLPAIPRLTIKWAGVDRMIPVHRDLRGVVNVDAFGTAESFQMVFDDGFMPVPEPELRTHIAGHAMSPRDYRLVGMFVAYDLMQLGLLWPNSRVLDLGCGCGRVASFIAPIVNERGMYRGFDTWQTGIDWATKHLTPLFPNATFQTLRDSGSRSGAGYVGERAYELPLKDGSVDLVLCSSLFTHLSFEAALAYLIELRRVLEPGGRAFVSCFVYDEEARGLLESAGLQSDAHGACKQHPGFFDIYFLRASLDELFARARLKPNLLRYGHWRGESYKTRRPIGYQDLFVLRPEP